MREFRREHRSLLLRDDGHHNGFRTVLYMRYKSPSPREEEDSRSNTSRHRLQFACIVKRVEARIRLQDRKKHGGVMNLELFYFERVGTRSYLRFTRLGLILILIFTVLPVIALLFLFLLNQSTPMPDTDVRIKPAAPINASMYPTIHQPTPLPTPKALRQPKAARPSPPVLPSPIRNSNER